MRMTIDVYRAIHCDLGRRPPEAGGLLLGPVGEDLVTAFYFDARASCTGSTYSPDHVTLRHKMATEWLPRGLDMKGFAHSHPDGLDRLSAGDLVYIRRLLDCNPDMDVFFAPVVLPAVFRFCPLVVERRDPSAGRRATLELVP